jgi:hypothetical protein
MAQVDTALRRGGYTGDIFVRGLGAGATKLIPPERREGDDV